MHPIVPLIVILLAVVLVVFPLWALIRILALGKENNALAWKLESIEQQLRALREKLAAASPPPAAPPDVAPQPIAFRTASTPVVKPEPAPEPASVAPETFTPETITPPDAKPTPLPTSAAPPPLPVPELPVATASPAPASAGIDWEQFMGAKLFAWLGGLAAFLGAAFFVKYSFEHDLIPPEVRVAIGYLFAIGLVIGGLKVPRPRYTVTGQTLCATGVVCLYAVTFACNSIYHFAFFGPIPTFVLMTLVTAAAFALAVRLDAQVVAILGILGGFLTPVLLSTGHDNPVGLFGYIALLDVGLIAVALQQRWHFLVPLGATGTVVMQIAWAAKFLNAAKSPTAMAVCLAFCALFLAAYFAARRFAAPTAADTGEPETAPRRRFSVAQQITWSAVAFPFVAFAFALVFLDYPVVAARPALLFSFVFLADACLLALAWWDDALPRLHLCAGLAVFALLAVWTMERLSAELLPWALAVYLLHAALHTAFPIVLGRHRATAAPTWWSQLFPPLSLLLLLIPLLKLDELSLLFWPCVLLIDLLAITLALFTASLVGVAAVLVLTVVATGVWIFHAPATAALTTSLVLVVGGFAILFFVAGIFLARRLGERLVSASAESTSTLVDPRAQIPAFSALLPFTLLVMMSQRLALADPSAIFGLALLLVGLTLGLTVVLTARSPGGEATRAAEWLPACALVGVAALEYVWHARHFHPDHAAVVLAWYVAFYAVFAGYPFVFRARFATTIGPWAVAALAGVVQFPLVYRLIERTRPNDVMGILPALFAVVPLASLMAILRGRITDERARLSQLAWFGAVALLFITLIFPIQFERQWITISWALEGVALLWLFQRVPHTGLRATAVVLLSIAFARLALNPAVLEYHARSTAPVFNWYLYSYGIVTVCLFSALRLLPREHASVLGVNARVLLATLGTILAFLLLNVEIADFFSVPGSRVLSFEFTGNFARDMSYTIGWALFALGLLLASFWKHTRAGRYAAITLLGIALLKLFFHDLARLQALYRIGALFAVAVIAIIASFAYQRFLPSHEPRAPRDS